MQKYRKPLIILVLLILASAIVIHLYQRNTAAVTIDAIKISAGEAQLVLAVVGRVRTKTVVDVRAEFPGAITDMFVDEGDSIERGEILALVRSESQQSRLAMAQADTRVFEAQLRFAQQDFERILGLSQKDLVAQQVLDQARTAVTEAKARLDSANEARNQANIRVDDFSIRSPLDGIVLARPIDPGQVIGLSDVIFQIGSSGAIEIEAEIDEIYASELTVSMQAILSPTGKAQRFKGRISEISPRVNPLNGARLTRLMLDEPNADFVPGRSIDVNIMVRSFDDALSIPRSALHKEGKTWFAYRIDSENISAKPVTFVDWPGSSVVLTSGLSSGATVAQDSFAALAAIADQKTVNARVVEP